MRQNYVGIICSGIVCGILSYCYSMGGRGQFCLSEFVNQSRLYRMNGSLLFEI